MSEEKICRTKDCGRNATGRFPVYDENHPLSWWGYCDCCMSAYNAGRKHKADETLPPVNPRNWLEAAEFTRSSTERIDIIEQALEVFSLLPETEPVRAGLLKACAHALIGHMSIIGIIYTEEKPEPEWQYRNANSDGAWSEWHDNGPGISGLTPGNINGGYREWREKPKKQS